MIKLFLRALALVGCFTFAQTVWADQTQATAGVAETVISSELHDLSALSMFMKADWVVQAVMLSLILASVLSWTVWLVKTVQISNAGRRANAFRKRLSETEQLTTIFKETQATVSQNRQNGQHRQIIETLSTECTEFDHKLKTIGASNSLSQDGVKERVAQRLTSLETHYTAELGKGVGVLASISSTAPFIGLFGTVWGIMNSFIGIASANTTNLSVVAPGIAEALLATAAGLVAAIPAALFYNYFSRKLSEYRRVQTAISSELMVLLSRYLEDKSFALMTKKATDQLPTPIHTSPAQEKQTLIHSV